MRIIYKEYFITTNQKWNIMFAKFNSFITENKKLPSTISKDKNERRLCEWLNKQHTNYKNKIHIMKDLQIYDKWTEFLSKYKQYLNFLS